jgi:hypothetical protein
LTFHPGHSGNHKGRPRKVTAGATSQICCRCGIEKPLTEYPRRYKGVTDRWIGSCRTCNTAHMARWRAANPERAKAAHLRQSLKDSALITWRQMRDRAKKAGVPCTLTVEEVKALLEETTICPVLNIPLQTGRGKGSKAASPDSPSIDRHRPELGYVQGNVVIMSWRANRMKYNSTAEEIYQLAEWMMNQEEAARIDATAERADGNGEHELLSFID